MRLLLDTHVLLWAAGTPRRLAPKARSLLDNPANQLLFSAVNLWEIAIKRGLGRDDFQVESEVLLQGLLANGYEELPVRSRHAVFLEHLPAIHRDPFDRILVAQATVERVTLVTADAVVSQYPGPIVKV